MVSTNEQLQRDERYRQELERAGFRCEPSEDRFASPYPPGHVWHLTSRNEPVVDDGRRCPACTQTPCACTGAP